MTRLIISATKPQVGSTSTEIRRISFVSRSIQCGCRPRRHLPLVFDWVRFVSIRVFAPTDLKFSSTPIINTLSDAFALIRFLQLRPWNDWKEFNEYIGRYEKKRPKLATDRLQTIFKTTLLRRNKDTVLDGKKLITLPQKTVELVKLEFCPEEREIYTAVSIACRFLFLSLHFQQVETKSQQIFNRFLRAGTVLRHYHYGRSRTEALIGLLLTLTPQCLYCCFACARSVITQP